MIGPVCTIIFEAIASLDAAHASTEIAYTR